MQYYLGIDIGTTSTKAVAFSITGNVLFSFSEGYAMYHPAPGFSEQNADEVYEALVKCVNQVVASMKDAPPLFMALSAAMHSLMAIDQNGEPMSNCIIWADNRASQVAEKLHQNNKAVYYYNITGVPVHAMSPLCKLFWMRQHQSNIYRQAFKFIGIKEYVCYKLTGQYLVDTPLASSTGLLNIVTLQWEQNIMDQLNLSTSHLSELVPPTYIATVKKVDVAGPLLHVPDATPLVIGGSDGALANLGAGAANGESMVVTIGTSSAARLVVNKVELDPEMRTFCYHLKDDLYIKGGPGNNGAVVMEWLKENLLETSESYAGLFSRAEKINPGSESLLFLPYILGERAPVWNSNARGVFFGLDINHTQSHLVRACMEGVLFGVYSIAKILLENRDVAGIHATGGFAQSKVWLQMLADVCNCPIAVSAAAESSALGAVMLGIEALGYEPLAIKPFITAFEPNQASNEMYMKCFEKFERLYKALQNEWVEPAFQPDEILV